MVRALPKGRGVLFGQVGEWVQDIDSRTGIRHARFVPAGYNWIRVPYFWWLKHRAKAVRP